MQGLYVDHVSLGLYGILEIVSHTPFRMNELRIRRMAFYLLAQPPYMYIHRSGIAWISGTPDGLQELIPGINLIGIGNEQEDKVEFLSCKIHFLLMYENSS